MLSTVAFFMIKSNRIEHTMFKLGADLESSLQTKIKFYKWCLNNSTELHENLETNCIGELF